MEAPRPSETRQGALLILPISKLTRHPQVWEALLKLITTANFGADSLIVEHGDFAALAPFACLLQGEAVELDSRGHELGHLVPGRFLLARAGVHTVRARTRCALLRVPLPDYEAFLRAHPAADVAGKAAVLLGLPYFSHWGLAAVRAAAYLCRTAAFAPGETIYSAFQAVDSLYIVAEGCVRCS